MKAPWYMIITVEKVSEGEVKYNVDFHWVYKVWLRITGFFKKD